MIFALQVQITTETCGALLNKVCVCAITFRNGNEIYTVNYCGGLYRKGFLHVGQGEDGLNDMFYHDNMYVSTCYTLVIA